MNLKTAIVFDAIDVPPHPQLFSLREKGESPLSFWERDGVRGIFRLNGIYARPSTVNILLKNSCVKQKKGKLLSEFPLFQLTSLKFVSCYFR